MGALIIYFIGFILAYILGRWYNKLEMDHRDINRDWDDILVLFLLSFLSYIAVIAFIMFLISYFTKYTKTNPHVGYKICLSPRSFVYYKHK